MKRIFDCQLVEEPDDLDYRIGGLSADYALGARRHGGRMNPRQAQLPQRHTQEPLLVAGPGRVEPVFGGHQDRFGIERQAEVGECGRGRHHSSRPSVGRTGERRLSCAGRVGPSQRDRQGSRLRKVVNGARRQERDEAWSSVNEAKAVMENAQVGDAPTAGAVCGRSDLARGTRSLFAARPTSPRRSMRLRSSSMRWSTIMRAKKIGRSPKPI